jgi:hypothetical protein
MGQSEPVAVGFKTALGVGKELEKVTLSSVNYFFYLCILQAE